MIARQRIDTMKPAARTHLRASWRPVSPSVLAARRPFSTERLFPTFPSMPRRRRSPHPALLPASLVTLCARRLAGLPDLCILPRTVLGPVAPASARGRRGRSLVGRLGPRPPPPHSRCSPFRRPLAPPRSVPVPPPCPPPHTHTVHRDASPPSPGAILFSRTLFSLTRYHFLYWKLGG